MTVKAPFVFILGMHRSGTSCLAGALERCGVYLGPVRRSGRFNERGYYELQTVQNIHEQILGLNRGTWRDPPQKIQINPYHREALKSIAGQLARKRPCGLKDPRVILILKTWLDSAPPPHALVATFRHPLAVAQSLSRRNRLSIESGLAIWRHYNDLLVQWHQEQPFPIIEFNLSDVGVYCRKVAAVAKMLGLSPNVSHLTYFISRELEHHAAADLPVPEECQFTHTYLLEHSSSVAEMTTSPGSRTHRLQRAGSYIAGAMAEAAFSIRHNYLAPWERWDGQTSSKSPIPRRRRWA